MEEYTIEFTGYETGYDEETGEPMYKAYTGPIMLTQKQIQEVIKNNNVLKLHAANKTGSPNNE